MVDRELTTSAAAARLFATLCLALPACSPSPEGGPSSDATSGPTWTEEIAPLVHEHCSGCHREGGPGEFELVHYEQAKGIAGLLREVVVARLMPPWPSRPDDDCTPLRDVRWLSQEAIDLIAAWVDNGAEHGPGTEPSLGLPEEQIFNADARIEAEAPYLVSPGDDDYRCFVVDPGLASDTYLTGFHVDLDAAEVVHHIQLYTLEGEAEFAWAEAEDAADPDPGFSCFNVAEGSYLDVWAPGDRLRRYPDGVGQALSAGTKFIYQVHFHPAEETVSDHTAVELSLSETVTKPASIRSFANFPLDLAPGQERLEVRRRHLLTAPGAVYGARLHMHERGHDAALSILRGGASSCVLDIPRWDFDWQLFYYFEEPIYVEAGDEVEVTCAYDTSDAIETTNWGQSTNDEMCLGYLLVAETP